MNTDVSYVKYASLIVCKRLKNKRFHYSLRQKKIYDNWISGCKISKQNIEKPGFHVLV